MQKSETETRKVKDRPSCPDCGAPAPNCFGWPPEGKEQLGKCHNCGCIIGGPLYGREG